MRWPKQDELPPPESLAGSAEPTQEIPRSIFSRRTGFLTLQVAAGPDLLSYVTLFPGKEFYIGREESCALALSDASVSRRHARVFSDKSGRAFIEDLRSTNGTLVNGQSVPESELKVGDQVEIGGVLLRLDSLNSDDLVHLARVQDRLRSAGRDPLTGLMTRGWLESELPLVAERYQSANLPFSMLFVDLDRFKSVNDTYGHSVGDSVLKIAGRLLMLHVRDNDFCVRYGGEEMMVFLPGSDLERANGVAERIRRALEEHCWGRTTPGLSVTTSIGVAEHYTNEPIQDWLERADQALYTAKHQGRNQVQLAA